MKKPPLIILDRDGVINYDSPNYIKHPDEWEAIPGSLESIATLKQAGIKIAIATNQSGIARGLYSEETLKQIHQKMGSMLAAYDEKIDKIFYCPHHPDDGCLCRKPAPAMLLNACKAFNVSPQDALMIGDRDTDAKAAMAADMPFIRVHETCTLLPEQSYPSLATFVNSLLD